MITKDLSECAVEINCIFENMSKDMLEKIPLKLQNFFKEIASKDYKFEYDISKKLAEQNIKDKTKGIIALIYKDYICNEAEKKEYISEYTKFLELEEQQKRAKYDPDAIFKQREKLNTTLTENTYPIVYQKTSWFRKLILKIKTIFSF